MVEIQIPYHGMRYRCCGTRAKVSTSLLKQWVVVFTQCNGKIHKTMWTTGTKIGMYMWMYRVLRVLIYGILTLRSFHMKLIPKKVTLSDWRNLTWTLVYTRNTTKPWQLWPLLIKVNQISADLWATVHSKFHNFKTINLRIIISMSF